MNGFCFLKLLEKFRQRHRVSAAIFGFGVFLDLSVELQDFVVPL